MRPSKGDTISLKNWLAALLIYPKVTRAQPQTRKVPFILSPSGVFNNPQMSLVLEAKLD